MSDALWVTGIIFSCRTLINISAKTAGKSIMLCETFRASLCVWRDPLITVFDAWMFFCIANVSHAMVIPGTQSKALHWSIFMLKPLKIRFHLGVRGDLIQNHRDDWYTFLISSSSINVRTRSGLCGGCGLGRRRFYPSRTSHHSEHNCLRSRIFQSNDMLSCNCMNNHEELFTIHTTPSSRSFCQIFWSKGSRN